MLLVAVTGPIGSGKTSALREFAEGALALGRSVDGFYAEAEGRDDLERGASSYTLVYPRTGERVLFAERQSVGYQFSVEAASKTAAWADGLAEGVEILLLDELGRLEAKGGGHMALWPRILEKKPKMVVAAVREDILATIEAKLGRKFDIVLPAGPQTAETLMRIASERPDWERIGKFGAGAGGLEMSVGAALHTYRFPLTGLAMSTTQTAVMTVAGDGLVEPGRVVWVSFISAGLKAFSPSGSRIGAMIAITVQGLLYSLSTRILGWNGVGIALGGALVGAWAATQGFFVQYLLLGRGLEKAYDEVANWVRQRIHLELPGLVGLVAAVVIVYALVGGTVGFVAWKRRSRLRDRMEGWLTRQGVAKRRKKFPIGLFVPLFIVAGILLSAGNSFSSVAMIVLRALAIGFLLFALVQRWNPVKLLKFLNRTGRWGQAYALAAALSEQKPRD